MTRRGGPDSTTQWDFAGWWATQAFDLAEHQTKRPSERAANRPQQSHHTDYLHAGRLQANSRLRSQQRGDQPERVVEPEVTRKQVQLFLPRLWMQRSDHVVSIVHVR